MSVAVNIGSCKKEHVYAAKYLSVWAEHISHSFIREMTIQWSTKALVLCLVGDLVP